MNMKLPKIIYRLILSISISTLFTASCTSDIELSEDNFQQSNTIKMTLNGSILDFDAVTTRATSSHDWKDGDILYLRFHTSNDIVIGQATYNKEKDWSVNYYGSLDINTKMQVEVTFFDDSSLNAKDDMIDITPTSAIYHDFEGKYEYVSGDGIQLNASLSPLTSRIRFKGEEGDFIMIGGINTLTSYNLKTGDFEHSNGKYQFISTEVNKSGYTDFIYGIFDDENTRQIKINKQEEDYWDYLYTLNCTDNMMAIGKSGWMNIPTPKSRNGWTMKQISGEENGHMWVDLGLPSGTKWADENVGADIAQWQEDGKDLNVFGEKYCWGQTSTSTCYNGSDNIQGTAYDTARYQWGGRWVMTSLEDFEEVLRNCIVNNKTNVYGYINALELCGNNGESIYLPYSVSGQTYWTSIPTINSYESSEGLGNGSLIYGHTICFRIDSDGSYKISTAYRFREQTQHLGSTSTTYYSNFLRAIIK